jgi:nitrate reductase cytochrome c-type subunit
MSTVVAAVLLIAVGVSGAVAVEQQPKRNRTSARLLLPYEGAPPLVPHEVEERKAICADCHTTGESGAPITPHPTRTGFCLQCHVGQDPTAAPFVGTKPAAR